MPYRLLLALVVCSVAGCGTTDPGAPTAGEPSEVDRTSARTAVEYVGQQPGLRVVGRGMGAYLVITLTGTAPLIVLNGSRSSIQELSLLLPDEITEVEVLTSMADTMVYGQVAALNGVVRVTARVGSTE